MVFFDCHACGESLKKNQVEKHYQFKCRNCNVLSCVDCGKNFIGDEYKEHVKCMTEDEKYGGLNYKAKPNANKGEKKQEAWIDQVEAAIERVTDRNLKNLLERIKGYSNIPRKKAKFVNFLKNSVRIQGNMPERAWDAISAEIAKNQSEPSTNGTAAAHGASTNGNTDNINQSNNTENTTSEEGQSEQSEKKLNKKERKLERQKKAGKEEKKDRKKIDSSEEEGTSKKKSKKRKLQDIEEEEAVENKEKSKKKKRKKESEEDTVEEKVSKKEKTDEDESVEDTTAPKAGKFRWEETITAILKKADDHTLSVKKLRKKVMAAHQEHVSSKPESEEALLAKFTKKINKNPKFKVSKDKVKLL